MIKVDLDTTPKGNFKYVIKGSVVVNGDITI